jgi:hypothetical protein
LAFIRNGGNLTTTYSSITSANRTPDELSIELKSVDLDQQRSVEYLLMIVDDKQVLKTFSGRKTFTKSRFALFCCLLNNNKDDILEQPKHWN